VFPQGEILGGHVTRPPQMQLTLRRKAMGNATKHAIQGQDADERDLLALIPEEKLVHTMENQIHVLRKGVICTTEQRARKRSPLEIVLEATEGFIPLWAENQVLRWRFNMASLSFFQRPDSIMSTIRVLLNDAITAWGDAVPIRFKEDRDNSDFEFVVEQRTDCTPLGCTLASAFFPDTGRHQFFIYPTMFEQNRKEQVDTMAHEFGHVFGLRHFFAPEQEIQWPSVVFGEHKPFSIMNYGENSELTPDDQRDLKLLYDGAWSGRIREINRTPVKLVHAFSGPS
jgi:Matrixin